MGKKTIVWLIAATALVVAGFIILGGTISMQKWDFTKLSTVKYETNTYELSEGFENISIQTNTADIVFVPGDRGSVVCYEQENAEHFVAVKDGTLTINIVDTRKWYEYIGVNWSTPKITVTLPQSEYGALSISSLTGDVEIPKTFHFTVIDISENTGNVTNSASSTDAVKIKTSTGDIRVESISAGTLDLSVSTGKVTVAGVTCQGDVSIRVTTGRANLTDIRCKNFVSRGDTGNLTLKNVVATEKLSLERSTGNITFDRCDAAEISVKTSTGKVSGSLLTHKVFITHTDTGRVSIPKTVTGGICEITTDTGDIRLKIQ